MNELLPIGLAAWIIQDGNYPDFKIGQEYAFALEFYAQEPLRILSGDEARVPTLISEGAAHFAVVGKSVHADSDWWVVDFGLPAYSSRPAPTPHEPGTFFEGGIYLGVDHFSYFERLSSLTNAPALIFDWRVERIEMLTAPFIEKSDRWLVRDPDKIGWCDLPETNAWKDDGGRAEYVLHCTRLSSQPRRKLNR